MTVHELAHSWWGIGTSTAAGADWLREAVPSILSVMRYPDVHNAEMEGARSRLEDGLVAIVDEDDGSTALEDLGSPYTVGPLTLAHLHGVLSTQGADLFDTLQALLAGAPTLERDLEPRLQCADVLSVESLTRDGRPTITHDDLVAAIDGTSPSFHCEMVHVGREGFPLVGVRDYDSTGPMEVVVGQVQDDLLGWPLFTEVPYHLLCDPVGGDPVPATCTGSELDLGPTPRLLSGASDAVPLGAEQTMYVGVITADQLLPEALAPWSLSVDDDAGRAPTRLVRCASGDTDPPCDVDYDRDGYPAAGDCDDDDATRNPGADMGGFLDAGSESVTLRDLDCDGWPTSRFPGAP